MVELYHDRTAIYLGAAHPASPHSGGERPDGGLGGQSPTTRFAGIIVDDPAHWAKNYGITTVEAYELSMALSEYSDHHKSYYGFRPRLDGFTTVAQVREAINDIPEFTAEELQARADYSAELAKEWEEQQAQMRREDEEFEQRLQDESMAQLEAKASK